LNVERRRVSTADRNGDTADDVGCIQAICWSIDADEIERGERPARAIVVRPKVASYIVTMATNTAAFSQLSDEALADEVARLAQCERSATAELIASLVEFDRRRLYLAVGFPSLFAYCTQRLHLSEHAAYHRIEAARAAQRFPVILRLLEEGALTLTAVGLLRPHLTEENHREVLQAARHLGKRAVEELAARLHARPDVRSLVRKLPGPRVAGAADRAMAQASVRSAADPPALKVCADDDRGAPAEVGLQGRAAGDAGDGGES
jgi:hypothetical protein